MNSYTFIDITDRMDSKHQLVNPKSTKSFTTGVLFFPKLQRIFSKIKHEKKSVLSYLHKN